MKTLLKITLLVLLMASCLNRYLGMDGGENMVEENAGHKHNDWKDVFKNFVELVDKAGDFYDIKVFLK